MKSAELPNDTPSQEPHQRISRMLVRKPKTVTIRKLRKNHEVCSGLTQAHGLQWSSSDFLFRTFKKMCSKALMRNIGFFQVNFLATNRTLRYLMPSLKLMKSVSNDTKIEVILAENYRVTNHVLINLSKALRYLKKLRNLAVDVERCDKISDKGILHLLKGLVPLKRLSQLKLTFGGDEFTNTGIIYLSKTLIKLQKQLEFITLCFIKCSFINDDGLKKLSSSISKLAKAKSLSLHFCWLTNITDVGFIEIGRALSQLKSLSHLTLGFRGCPKLETDGFTSVSHSFFHFDQLLSLNLTFFKLHQFGDEDLLNLAKGVGCLTSLRSLTLRFAICKQITDSGISLITDCLPKLRLLKSLILNIIDCEKVTDEAVFYLSGKLESCSIIKSMEISFFQCPLVTHQGQGELLNIKLKYSELLNKNFIV